MPWQEVVTMELRQPFVHDALRRVVPQDVGPTERAMLQTNTGSGRLALWLSSGHHREHRQGHDGAHAPSDPDDPLQGCSLCVGSRWRGG